MNPKTPHIMIDLETFGVGTNAAIISIGACVFYPLEEVQVAHDEFYCVIDPALSGDTFGIIEPATVMWWLKQSEEAREALVVAEDRTISLAGALLGLAEWKEGIVSSNDYYVWSKPAMFDQRLLQEAYARCELVYPFHYRTSRCMRTLEGVAKDFGFSFVEGKDAGVKHHALDDAKQQAQVVTALYRVMGTRLDA